MEYEPFQLITHPGENSPRLMCLSQHTFGHPREGVRDDIHWLCWNVYKEKYWALTWVSNRTIIPWPPIEIIKARLNGKLARATLICTEVQKLSQLQLERLMNTHFS